MSRPFRDEYDHDNYGRDHFRRERDLAHEVFFDELASRERTYRDLRPDYPPYGPEDPYYRRMDEVDARELIPRGPSRFVDPILDPPIPPRDRSLMMDPLPPMDPLSPREFRGEEKRFGPAFIVPPLPGSEPRKQKVYTEAPSNTLYVGGIPPNTTEQHLDDVFKKYGAIVSIRIRRNYAHIQFRSESLSGVIRALELDGSYIRVGPTTLKNDYGKIQVAFSIRRESETNKQETEDQDLPYNSVCVSTVSSDLHKEEKFSSAVKNLTTWLEQGQCTSSTSNTFFGLVSSVNTCARRLKKKVKDKEDELQGLLKKHRERVDGLDKECKAVLGVFQAASLQKARDHFTKAQRKSITQWIDSTNEIQEEIMKMYNCEDVSEGLPPTKVRKTEAESAVTEELEAVKRDLEQLKAEKEVAVQGRDKQILQLRSLIAKFKKSCPAEWEKVIGEKSVKAESAPPPGKDKKSKKPQPLPPGVEEEGSPSPSTGIDSGLEVIEEVNMDDINDMDIEDQDEDNSLAAAAAAYAQCRSTIGSTTTEGLGLSESEIAVVSVLAAFLTVHPLGATINEITMYFQGFNPTYNSYYLESLLRRLSKVFQLGGDGTGKWWFLGFQTCYTAVSEKQTNTATTSEGQEEKDHES